VEQSDVLRYVLEVLEAQGLQYMLVGSLASGVFGEGRLTLDIDIVVELAPAQIEPLCQAFPAPDYCVSVKAAHDAVDRGGQFNVIHIPSGNKIDFMLARRDEWGRAQLARRREEIIIPGRPGFVASPEDVILGKMWYYREGEHEKHLRDIAAMLCVSGDQINREYIGDWSNRLGLTAVWQAVLKRLAGSTE
jgi:hypothetical protein